MSSMENLAVYFAKTPQPGPLTADVFEFRPIAIPELNEGEILVRTIYISLDAGSRAQLDDRGGYVFKTPLGQMPASSGIVGEIVKSRNPAWKAGDLVSTFFGSWQRYHVFDPAKELFFNRLNPADGPLAIHLGALGLVGITAFIGMTQVGKPKAGETVLVSAAAGATGALAGQFAKIAGARVIGIAGGEAKCKFVKTELGFDDCIDYKRGDIRANIKAACPDGVDVYFENVGGEIQKAVFEQMNVFGRIAMCGQIGQYSGEGEAPGPNLMCTVLQRLTIQGFLCSDHFDKYGTFIETVTRWYKEGRVSHHATITQGLENIHEAINSLVGGGNIGKQLCQVSPDPTAP